MAITNASRLADFGTGIGTEGAVIDIDNANAQVGLGTTNPNSTVTIGPVGASGTSLFVHGDGRVTGVLTAANFSGDLTGAVTSSGALSVTDTTASTSTTTGALKVSGGIGVAKSIFVGEGISIAGTITYNDVTNIDSIGIVTGGKGLRATTGGLIVSAGVATIGAKLSVAGITSLGDVVSSGIITADSYYGSGANLTGIDAGPAGVNTTGFSTFKDISVQGISTFSNLTDATSTTAASLVLSGGVGVAKSIYLGQNLHIADGKGIDFFAAGGSTATGATRTSNVLDHYEEGSWDPVLNAGTTGAVSNYDYQDGFFVRIGGLLYVSFFVKGSSTSGLGSGSGDLWVTGLPFSVSSFPSNTISVPDCQLAATDVDTTAYGWYITGEYYSDRFYIYYRSSTTNQGAMGGQCTATVSVACRTCVRCY